MRDLRYTAAARHDLDAIAGYIVDSGGDEATAMRFVARVHAKCEKLASLPGLMGTARPELAADLRSTPFGNYVVFFRYQEGALEIVTVVEGHRDIARHFRADDA